MPGTSMFTCTGQILDPSPELKEFLPLRFCFLSFLSCPLCSFQVSTSSDERCVAVVTRTGAPNLSGFEVRPSAWTDASSPL